MIEDNGQKVEGKSLQNKMKKISGIFFDFLVKRKNWIIFAVMMIMLAFLAQMAYEYFQIGKRTAEFNVSEVKIKTVELGKLEEYIAAKSVLLVEKKQRIYRDLFR